MSGGVECGQPLATVPGSPVRTRRKVDSPMPASHRTCSIVGCPRPYRVAGLCRTHYSRQLRGQHANTVTQYDHWLVKLFSWSEEGAGGCWLWIKSRTSEGYGQLSVGGVGRHVHRLMWTHLRGPIPEGLVIDHLCRVRHCVNPDHMEVVTRGENVLRGVGPSAANAQKTHCPRGHAYNAVDPRGGRACAACRRSQRRGQSA